MDKRSDTLLCVIKIKGTSKSFYLGKINVVKSTIYTELDEDWSDYSFNKLKICLRDIIESVIMDFIDITNIKSLFEVGNKLSFNNVLEKYKTKKTNS
jgi:hypothetical protein